MNSLMQYTALDISGQFLVGGVAAGVATLVMDRVMMQLPEGETPPRVAAGILTNKTPAAASSRLAIFIHYTAAILTGPLFVWLRLSSEAIVGPTPVHILLAIAALYTGMVGFFIGIVLPRADITSKRVHGIRRDWAISATSYVVVTVVIVWTALPN
jgi:hypothetical protein